MGTRVTPHDQPHRVAGLPPLVGAALRAVLWIGLEIGVAGPDAISSLEAQTEPRLVTVISDLHIGTGRDESGAWHPTEDFRWDDEFALFLEHLTALGENANDLVLNGDTFELSEAVRGVDGCQYDVPALGCTQDEALARLDVVLSAHARAIDALANFAGIGSNRIFVIPGDHDAALMFPAVAARARQALGGVEAGVQIQMEGFWASSDGKVYAEHGHQIGDRPNRFSQWPPAVGGSTDGSDTRHLERPWGIQTVGEFFTQHEPRYPTIDNIAERGAGLSYGLAASGTARLGR